MTLFGSSCTSKTGMRLTVHSSYQMLQILTQPRFLNFGLVISQQLLENLRRVRPASRRAVGVGRPELIATFGGSD